MLPKVRGKSNQTSIKIPATQSNWQLRNHPKMDLLERAQRIEDRVLQDIRRKNNKSAAN